MLIRDPQQRKTQRENKIRCALRHLDKFIYSDFSTLKSMFGFRNHRVLYSLLNALNTDGLIRKHSVSDGLKSRSLWAITDKGRSVISTGKIMPVNFRPEQIKKEYLHYHIMAQRIYLYLKKKDFVFIHGDDWLYREYYPDTSVNPDFVIQTENKMKIAVFVHAKIRTPARYKKIITENAGCIMKKYWSHTLFITEDEATALAISIIIKNITHWAAPYNNEIKEGEKKRFRVVSLDALSSLEPDTWN